MHAEQRRLVEERLDLVESGNWAALLEEVRHLAAAALAVLQAVGYDSGFNFVVKTCWKFRSVKSSKRV